MGILAGFDAVVEFGPAALLTAIRSNPTFARFLPPVEFRRTLVDDPGGPTDQGGGEAHFIFDRVGVTITQADAITLEVHFSGASVIGNRFVGEGFHRQAGKIAISIPISLVIGAAPTRRAVRLAASADDIEVVTRFTPSGHPSANQVAAAISLAVAGEVTAAVQGSDPDSDPWIDIQLPIEIDAARPSINPLVVADMQLRVFPSADPDLQALALFLDFGAGGADHGIERTVGSLARGIADFKLVMSSRAVREVVIAPFLQGMLRVPTRDALPADFGTAASVAMPAAQGPPEAVGMPIERTNMHIEQFQAELANNGVRMSMRARFPGDDDAFGTDMVAAVTGLVGLRVWNGELRTEWRTQAVDAGHEYGWGWYVTGIFGPFLLMTAVEVLYHQFAFVAARSIAAQVPNVTIPLPAILPGLTFSYAAVNPAGFGLSGVAPPAPAADTDFALAVTHSSTDFEVRQVDDGLYQSEYCPVGTYPYTAYVKGQRVRFDAAVRFGHSPIDYRWSIWTGTADIALSGSGRTNVSVRRTQPGPPPVDEFPIEVEVGYTVSERGARLELEAAADQGQFALNVRCIATDASGHQSSYFRQVHFTTRTVDFSNTSWDEDQRACVERLRQRLEQLNPRVVATRAGGPPGELHLSLAAAFRPEVLTAVTGRLGRQAAGTMRNVAIHQGAALPLAVARGDLFKILPSAGQAATAQTGNGTAPLVGAARIDPAHAVSTDWTAALAQSSPPKATAKGRATPRAPRRKP